MATSVSLQWQTDSVSCMNSLPSEMKIAIFQFLPWNVRFDLAYCSHLLAMRCSRLFLICIHRPINHKPDLLNSPAAWKDVAEQLNIWGTKPFFHHPAKACLEKIKERWKIFEEKVNGSDQTETIQAEVEKFPTTVQIENRFKLKVLAITRDLSVDKLRYSYLNNDEEFILKALSLRNACYLAKYVPDKLKGNIDFALKMVKIRRDYFHYLPVEILNSRQFFEKLFEFTNDSMLLQYASQEIRKSPEIVLKALSKGDPLNLSLWNDLPAELKNNFSFIIDLISSTTPISVFREIPITLRNNTKVLLAGALRSIHVLLYASPEFRNNRDIMLQVIRMDVRGFYHLSSTLQKHPDFVSLLRIIKDHKELKRISDRLKEDPLFMQAAASLNKKIIKNLPERFRQNKDFILTVAANKNSPGNLSDFKEFFIKRGSRPYRSDSCDDSRNEDFIELLSSKVVEKEKKCNETFNYLPKNYQQDRDVILRIVSMCGFSIKNLSPHFRDDEEIALTAIIDNPSAFVHISSRLRHDPTFLRLSQI